MVTVICQNPSSLLSAIKAEISNGNIDTWIVDAEGDFTHSPPQWKLKAWLRPRVREDQLVFNILSPQGVQLSKTTYGVYHGRFIEMLLTHFDEKFQRAAATALASTGDRVGP